MHFAGLLLLTLLAADAKANPKKSLRQESKNCNECGDGVDPLGCDSSFDYVVVGAGASGTALAERLRAGGASVVILEQGGYSNNVTAVNTLARWPELLGDLACAVETGEPDKCPTDVYNFMSLDYKYQSNPELISPGAEPTPGRVIPVYRSAITGGCTSHNAGIWLRPPNIDWDNWELPDWDWDNMKHYWEEVDQKWFKDATYVGKETDTWTEIFRQACKDQDLPFNPESNVGNPSGCQLQEYAVKFPGGIPVSFQDNSVNQTRVNGWTQFIEPALSSELLTIFPYSQALEVLFKDEKEGGKLHAYGVKVQKMKAPHISLGEESTTVCARKEIIVSAGAIDTVSLLLRSGIGDKAELEKLGVDVKVDLPAVGTNLHDHFRLSISGPPLKDQEASLPEAMPGLTEVAWTWNDIIQWTPYDKTGLSKERYVQTYRAAYGTGLAYDPALAYIPKPPHFIQLPSALKSTLAGCTDIQVFSRGTVKLTSVNQEEKPIIDFNVLSDPRDLPMIRQCVAATRRFLASESLLPLYTYEDIELESEGALFPFYVYNGAGGFVTFPGETDDEVDDYIRTTLTSNGHVCCTARMGVDKTDAVVDERLKVFGTNGLRIADASILPELFRSNPQTGLYMIGLHAGDMILEDAK